jgi:hypothetical protein
MVGCSAVVHPAMKASKAGEVAASGRIAARIDSARMTSNAWGAAAHVKIVVA